jgi:erythromycin esterase-like protein
MTPEKNGRRSLSNSKDLDSLIERAGNARIVLLGEASHGTHEYYTWRAAISKRLIAEHGFNFVAVEGDWPDCYRVNRYVKGFELSDKKPEQVLHSFNRWPTWMWANWEVAAFISWLRQYNDKLPVNRKAGFYGLDVYSLWESMEALLGYLEKTDPSAARIAEKALDCFEASGRNEQDYAVQSLSGSCRDEVSRLLKEIRLKSQTYNHDPEAALNTTQNAHIAVEAEKYYSNMVKFNVNTWNIRDQHMMDSLVRVLDYYGPNSKAIVWEHNTHVGDSRYTDMADSGTFNIGELARKKYPGSTFIVGFGSYGGAVIAGDSWGAPMREMEVPDAKKGSVEELLHSESAQNKMLIFDEIKQDKEFDRVLPHRAIGVVYHPSKEQHNYVPSHFNKRYDAFLFFDETSALHPLHLHPDPGQVPETYPFEF